MKKKRGSQYAQDKNSPSVPLPIVFYKWRSSENPRTTHVLARLSPLLNIHRLSTNIPFEIIMPFIPVRVSYH